MVWFIIIGSLVVPLIAGLVAVRNGTGWFVGASVAVLIGATLFLTFKAEQAQGWDRLGWGMWIYLVTLPGIVGVLIGGALGLWARKRAERQAPDENDG